MKKVIIPLLALLLIMAGCKKDDMPLMVGQSYYLKSNVFSDGAFQPVSPVTVESLYIDPASGLSYVKASAKIDWANFNQNNAGNKLTLQGLTKQGINFGDSRPTDWYIPQKDLN